jgi:hypothetical protein
MHLNVTRKETPYFELMCINSSGPPVLHYCLSSPFSSKLLHTFSCLFKPPKLAPHPHSQMSLAFDFTEKTIEAIRRECPHQPPTATDNDLPTFEPIPSAFLLVTMDKLSLLLV